MDTSREQVETVMALASKSFARHQLSEVSPNGAGRHWRCGAPDTVCHSFRVATFPGMIVIWGDLGEYVFRMGDADSMRWLMGATSRDYFLSKVAACDGAKREFMIGDARAYLRSSRESVEKEIQDQVDEDSTFDPDLEKQSKTFVDIEEEFDDLLEDEEIEPAQCWALANYRHTGDPEWPRCDEWSSSLLWLWEGVKVFRHLHRQQWLVSRIHYCRSKLAELVEKGATHEGTITMVRNDLAAAETELAAWRADDEKKRAEAAGGAPAVPGVHGDGGGPVGAPGGPQPGAGVQDLPGEVPR